MAAIAPGRDEIRGRSGAGRCGVLPRQENGMKLAGKIAVTTGGATGIGGATAELCAAEGAVSIILDYNRNEGRGTLERIEKAGGRGEFHEVDVRREEQVAAVFAKIAAAHGRVDVLICSAGVLTGAHQGITELAEEDWDTTIDTNLKGTYLTGKHAAPLLRASPSSVLLLISSGAGVSGGSSSYAYAASKGGMHGMQHNFGKELPGTRVHVVCPGSIATPLKLKNIGQAAEKRGEDPEAAKEAAKKTLGDPVGVARVLAFLASEDADYIRGDIRTR